MAISKQMKTAALAGAAILAVVALGVLAVWLLPSWLTQHPRVINPADRHKAVADTRTGVVAFLAVLGGIGGLYYTARTFRVSRDAQIDARNYANETSRLSAQTLRLNERGQITDRYSKAVEMLGSPSHEICIGGATPWATSCATALIMSGRSWRRCPRLSGAKPRGGMI
jgi:hypothetical protein